VENVAYSVASGKGCGEPLQTFEKSVGIRHYTSSFSVFEGCGQ
jgi:hypothetical protein